jgi:hypothetical protein
MSVVATWRFALLYGTPCTKSCDFFKARDKQGAALIVLLYSDMLLLCVAVF